MIRTTVEIFSLLKKSPWNSQLRKNSTYNQMKMQAQSNTTSTLRALKSLGEANKQLSIGQSHFKPSLIRKRHSCVLTQKICPRKRTCSKDIQDTEFGMHHPHFVHDSSERLLLTGQLLGSLWTGSQEPALNHQFYVVIIVELVLLAALFLEGQSSSR